MSLRYQFIESFDDFKKYQDTWEKLRLKNSELTIFSSYFWYSSWWKAKIETGEKVSPKIIIIYEKNKIIAFLPLMVVEKELVFLSSSAADYQNFIIEQKKLLRILKNVLDFIFEDIKPESLHLEEISENSNLFKLFNNGISNFEIKKYNTSACPRLTLDKSQKRFQTSTLKRKFRNLLKLGNVEVKHFISSEKILPELPLIKELFRERWESRPESWFFFKEFDDVFFKQLISQMADNGLVLLSKMSVEDEPIAYYFGFTEKNVYRFYRSAFSQKFKKFSPGHILLNFLFSNLTSKGYNFFDFLRGDYDYKKSFADRTILNYGFLIRKSLK